LRSTLSNHVLPSSFDDLQETEWLFYLSQATGSRESVTAIAFRSSVIHLPLLFFVDFLFFLTSDVLQVENPRRAFPRLPLSLTPRGDFFPSSCSAFFPFFSSLSFLLWSFFKI